MTGSPLERVKAALFRIDRLAYSESLSDAALARLNEETRKIAAAVEEAERRELDNHHNAATCPYCGDLLGKAEARAAAAEQALREIADARPDETSTEPYAYMATWAKSRAREALNAGPPEPKP